MPNALNVSGNVGRNYELYSIPSTYSVSALTPITLSMCPKRQIYLFLNSHIALFSLRPVSLMTSWWTLPATSGVGTRSLRELECCLWRPLSPPGPQTALSTFARTSQGCCSAQMAGRGRRIARIGSCRPMGLEVLHPTKWTLKTLGTKALFLPWREWDIFRFGFLRPAHQRSQSYLV